ncbi:hypothetical protein BD626DRAFT_495129 [Schizophyllum amplum]|uniref:Amidohydrolase-related domain-containing protein n=1 Tax=Schizophyllum amplum TaxID=97359 RepID=A0A550CG98_9AGAR|nr:hypothetical protein BD626DRAFT_495129 [Auriculariopsis ampla]
MKGAAPGASVRVRQRYAQLVAMSVLSVAAAALFWSFGGTQRIHAAPPIVLTDPARDWRDDVWPLREQTPWDISTDFPYPRRYEADVSEGTWLRLDVHPTSGDIVFDILGDIYCIAADDDSIPARARPVLLGVPSESDAHFSPDGTRLAFRSDAGLGLENIWVIPWHGCAAMDVRPTADVSPDLAAALSQRDADDTLLGAGLPETVERRSRRLLREGRLDAMRVTNETFRFVSDPRWHPSGERIIAQKWFTGTITIPGGEGWIYTVPPQSATCYWTVSAGAGDRTVIRDLPRGWKSEDYNNVNLGPEQLLWWGNDAIIYSKNVQKDGGYEYGQNVHKGVYAIFAYNLTTETTEKLVDALPGGASRPELSRDQRTLAFVRRLRDKQALMLLDLVSGTLHHVWDGLSHDLQLVGGVPGTYPSFAFTPADNAIIIWAAGQIWRVPLALNARGERIAGGIPFPIKFTAHLEIYLADTRKETLNLTAIEIQPMQPIRALRELSVDYTGTRATFEGAGVTYVYDLATNSTTEVPRLQSNKAYFAPSFIPDSQFVIHTRWQDGNPTDTNVFSTFEIADMESRRSWEVAGLPQGRHFTPVVSFGQGRVRTLAFVRTAGDAITGHVVETARPGLYVARLELPDISNVMDDMQDTPMTVNVIDVHLVPSHLAASSTGFLKLQFTDLERLLVHSPTRTFAVDLGSERDAQGKPVHTPLAHGKMSSELYVRPTSGQQVKDDVAFVDHYHVYYAPQVAADTLLWAKPTNATHGLVRLSANGGHDLAWSGTGDRVYWLAGPTLHALEIDRLGYCEQAIQLDELTFGIDCVAGLVERYDLPIEHSTDTARLRAEASRVSESADNSNADVLVIANATILTMATGEGAAADIYDEGVMIIRGGVIESLGPAGAVVIPDGSTVFNAHGGFVTPGFIDVHAHWGDYMVRYPAASWEMETFLAYGVTTMHNPSAMTVDVFAQRSRIERGQLIGPRVFSTGMVLFGGGWPGIHHEIVDMRQAREALERIRVEGGPYMLAYKNYQLPSRASRQRLLLAAREMGLMCVPEGGANWDWDLTYILDGMTTMEHSLPVSPLYDDVLTMFAASGSGYTPTHIVSYDGIMGEEIIWADEDIPSDPKLRQFIPHTTLYELTESSARPKYSFELWNMTTDAARLAERGVRVHIGAHGEQPMGLNYHSEMWFTRQGGLSNYEVYRAATLDAARTLGLDSAVGSLTPGRLADFVVYPPDVDILSDDIRRSRELSHVARGGRLWNAATMEEVWPVKGRRHAMPPFNVE